MSYHCGLPQGPCGLPRGLMCGSPRGPRKQTLRPKFSIFRGVFLAIPTEMSCTTPFTGPFQQRLMMQQWLGRSGLDVGLRKRPSVTAADQVCIKTSPGSVFIEPGRKDLGRLPTLKTYPQNYSMGGSLSNPIYILLNLS